MSNVQKSVFFAYPYKSYYEGTDMPNRRTHDKSGRFLTAIPRTYHYSKRVLNERLSLMNVVLDNYRDDGYRILFGMSAKSPVNRDTVDMTDVTDFISMNPSDELLSVGVTFDELNNQCIYPDSNEVMKTTFGSTPTDIIFGGFHSEDCVPKFQSAANRLGHNTSIDPLLTEDLFERVYGSFVEDLNEFMIYNGKLDPCMHEDIPLEDRRALFDGRLNSYVDSNGFFDE